MKLFCAVNVQKKLGCTCNKTPVPADPLDGWYVNLIQLNEKDTVVAILPKFRFCAVLFNVEKEDWPKLNELLVSAIRDALYHPYYRIPRSVIDNYLPEDTVFELCATTDRGIIARMSTVTTQLLGHDQYSTLMSRGYGEDSFRDPDVLQFLVNKQHFAENGNWRNDWKEPWKRVKEQLQVPAMRLELSLDLPGWTARRTLLVPADTTFEYLHHYTEAAFLWSRYRQYRFVLPPMGEREVPLPILGTTAEEDVYEPEGLYLWDDEVRLAEYVRKGDRFQYLYYTHGAAEPWPVQITVRSCIRSAEEPLPVCTQCSGKAPRASYSAHRDPDDNKVSVERVNERLLALDDYLYTCMDNFF